MALLLIEKIREELYKLELLFGKEGEYKPQRARS